MTRDVAAAQTDASVGVQNDRGFTATQFDFLFGLHDHARLHRRRAGGRRGRHDQAEHERLERVALFEAERDHLTALRGIERDGIERGQVLAKPGSITPHTKFEANIYVLSKEEGGRHTPFFKGYKPQFYFRTTDVTGSITLPAEVEMCMPGDNVKITVELMEGMPVAMDEGLRFAIREGGKTVGSGVVTKIIA